MGLTVMPSPRDIERKRRAAEIRAIGCTMPLGDLARQFGVAKSTVSRILTADRHADPQYTPVPKRPNPPRLSAMEKAAIRQEWLAGASVIGIARRHGVASSTVTRLCAGLHRRTGSR